MIDLSFAAMTAPTHQSGRPTTGAPGATIGRGNTSGGRRRNGRPTPPLDPLLRWRIAMRYALGHKTESIAAEEGITIGGLCRLARGFGLPPRLPPRTGKPDLVAVKILRDHAAILSDHHHSLARRWAAAALAGR